MSKQPELTIIENEIKRLRAQSKKSGLSLEDVKKLETLIKTRQLVLGEPTEITKTTDGKPVSDAAVLEALTPKEHLPPGPSEEDIEKKLEEVEEKVLDEPKPDSDSK